MGDDELTCNPRKITTISSTQSSTSIQTRGTRIQLNTPEMDDIILFEFSTEETKTEEAPSTQTNDDTLIIGIVGGVVAFIAILVIIICIIRLKMSNNQFNGPPVLPPGIVSSGSSCACSVKGAPTVYAVPPYAAGYSSTLPHKLVTTQSLRPSNYSTMGRVPYYQNGAQPYFIAAYPSDEKMYR